MLTGLNEDTQAFQMAIGDKVGNTIHHVVTFIAGIIVAFIKGWKLTLVMLSLTPLLGLAGTFLTQVMTKGALSVPTFAWPLNTTGHGSIDSHYGQCLLFQNKVKYLLNTLILDTDPENILLVAVV